MKIERSKKWVGLGFGLLIIFFATWAYGQNQDEYCATLSDMEGDVSIQKAGEEEWLPVEKGMPLENQDRLKTGKDGYAEILYDDGSLVKMEENSEITLEEVSADYKSKKITSKISLLFGRLLLNIAKFTHTQSRFTVKTPTVVAGVRGTEFVTEATALDEQTKTVERTDVGVIDGEVGVESLDAEGKPEEGSQVIVRPGFQTSGMKFQRPIVPVPLKERMLIHTKQLEVLRKKAVVNRRDLIKIIRKRVQTRELIINKWKKMRDDGLIKNAPKRPVQGAPLGTRIPQIQRPTPGSTRPGTQPSGVRKLPPPTIRRYPPQRPESAPQGYQSQKPSTGTIGTPPLIQRTPTQVQQPTQAPAGSGTAQPGIQKPPIILPAPNTENR